jgi:hypothetical protein
LALALQWLPPPPLPATLPTPNVHGLAFRECNFKEMCSGKVGPAHDAEGCWAIAGLLHA